MRRYPIRVVRHLYVHTPFCARVCPYCAFYVHTGGGSAQRDFVAALRTEWRSARQEFRLELETIYFGGGTPSILSAELFTELASELPKLRNGIEFTLEVNPATVTPEKADAWRAAGVTRLSLGAQSFDPEALRLLGRQHTPDDIPATCELLRQHGFTNLNLDLMFALPGVALPVWEETLRAALACEPQHISAYALTYEEDTPFFEKLRRGEWQTNEEAEAEMFTRTRELLAAERFMNYEISNFARPGFESRHNLAYWRGADYLGLGPSACSTIGTQRWRNVPNSTEYQRRIACGESLREETEELSAATRALERIMFGLRMREGVATAEINALQKSSKLESLTEHGLIEASADSVRLTPRGQLVADSVAAEFI